MRLRSIPDCSELEWQEASLDLPRPGTEEGAAANRTAGNVVGGGAAGSGQEPHTLLIGMWGSGRDRRHRVNGWSRKRRTRHFRFVESEEGIADVGSRGL